MNAKSRLVDKYCSKLKPGKIEWIGLRSSHKGSIELVQEVEAIAGLGLRGDHRCEKTPGSARQVTFISVEFIQQISLHLNMDEIPPELLRRNIVISGMNLNALRYQKVKIGSAVFEMTAQCHPCSRMEKAIGEGAIAAMMGYGGLCAKVIKAGKIGLGYAVNKMDAIQDKKQ